MNAISTILPHINHIRANKGLDPLDLLSPSTHLRRDLGMDSLDLAELTVRLEKETGVDVFAEGIVSTVGEVLDRING